MNSAAEQVVPAMAATRPKAPVLGTRGTRPAAMAAKSGLTMKNTTVKQNPIKITQTVSTFSKSW